MTNKDRNRYLLKNTTIFAIGNLGTKIINFFLVPLYTGILTQEEYGTTDVIYTILTIVSPFIMLSMGEAILRFSLDKDADHNKILSISFVTMIVGSILALFTIPVLGFFDTLSKYAVLIYLYLIMLASHSLLLCYLRGREKLVLYTICNLLCTFCIAGLNVVFLSFYRWGIKGYLLAYILAYAISNVVSIIVGRQYKVLSSFEFSFPLFKKMFVFSLAVIPNSLMWWITNSSDRLMVTSMVGIAANGIYAVSSKLPSLVSALSDIFLKAWSYSAVKEEESNEGAAYSNLVYEKMLESLCIIGALLLLILKPFTKIYVSHSYYIAWKYSTWLIVGSIFSCLGTFVGTPYFVHKDSKANLYSSMFGAIINIILNLLLIPVMGVMGAAIATCISYVSVYIYKVIDTRKYLKLRVFNLKYMFSVLVVLGMLAIEYLDGKICAILLLTMFMIELVINRDMVLGILKVPMKIIGK